MTYPKVWNNSSKEVLIPHVVLEIRGLGTKDFGRFGRGPRPIS